MKKLSYVSIACRAEEGLIINHLILKSAAAFFENSKWLKIEHLEKEAEDIRNKISFAEKNERRILIEYHDMREELFPVYEVAIDHSEAIEYLENESYFVYKIKVMSEAESKEYCEYY